MWLRLARSAQTDLWQCQIETALRRSHASWPTIGWRSAAYLWHSAVVRLTHHRDLLLIPGNRVMTIAEMQSSLFAQMDNSDEDDARIVLRPLALSHQTLICSVEVVGNRDPVPASALDVSCDTPSDMLTVEVVGQHFRSR